MRNGEDPANHAGPPDRPGGRRGRVAWLVAGVGLAGLAAAVAFLLAQHGILERIETSRGAGGGPWDGMAEVPAGEFRMGSAFAEAPSDEKPDHAVFVSAFLIDKVEVSNARFKEFVDATGAPPPKNLYDRYDLWTGGSFPPEAAHLPVINVDWGQASGYCQWAGKRLPTEAEWEKAARGTDGRRYPWGETEPDLGRANFGRGWQEAGSLDPVDSHAEGASRYGVLNLAGNVAEWVSDWYDPGFYAVSPASDPTGPAQGESRSIRGGSYESKAAEITATHRDSLVPGDHFFRDVGFRCATSIEGG